MAAHSVYYLLEFLDGLTATYATNVFVSKNVITENFNCRWTRRAATLPFCKGAPIIRWMDWHCQWTTASLRTVMDRVALC